ncbi:MAG: hypothetical protein ACLFS9_07685, partial [Nitriliruptoraceae bacterium]
MSTGSVSSQVDRPGVAAGASAGASGSPAVAPGSALEAAGGPPAEGGQLPVDEGALGVRERGAAVDRPGGDGDVHQPGLGQQRAQAAAGVVAPGALDRLGQGLQLGGADGQLQVLGPGEDQVMHRVLL